MEFNDRTTWSWKFRRFDVFALYEKENDEMQLKEPEHAEKSCCRNFQKMPDYSQKTKHNFFLPNSTTKVAIVSKYSEHFRKYEMCEKC